jgi:hypothetical protein
METVVGSPRAILINGLEALDAWRVVERTIMLIMSMDGAQWRCDACSQLITERGLALFRPLTGPADQAEVLTVCSKTCSKSPMIVTLLPRYSSRKLGEVLQQLADTLSVEE